MLQNARVTAFTISELLREKKQGGVKLRPPPPTHTHIQIRVNSVSVFDLMKDTEVF